MKSLSEILNQQEHTSDNDKMIKSLFKKEHFKKKSLIFRNGDYNTKHYVIASGLLRMYVINSSGKEFNILFAKENQLIGDLGSPLPTKFYLDAIEDSIVYTIESSNLEKLTNLLDSNQGKTVVSQLTRSYIFLQNRLISILTQTAEENFISFQKRYPDLIQRLPQYHIASYLGVSAEFLSKIIAKTAKK